MIAGDRALKHIESEDSIVNHVWEMPYLESVSQVDPSEFDSNNRHKKIVHFISRLGLNLSEPEKARHGVRELAHELFDIEEPTDVIYGKISNTRNKVRTALLGAKYFIRPYCLDYEARIGTVDTTDKSQLDFSSDTIGISPDSVSAYQHKTSSEGLFLLRSVVIMPEPAIAFLFSKSVGNEIPALEFEIKDNSWLETAREMYQYVPQKV